MKIYIKELLKKKTHTHTTQKNLNIMWNSPVVKDVYQQRMIARIYCLLFLALSRKSSPASRKLSIPMRNVLLVVRLPLCLSPTVLNWGVIFFYFTLFYVGVLIFNWVFPRNPYGSFCQHSETAVQDPWQIIFKVNDEVTLLMLLTHCSTIYLALFLNLKKLPQLLYQPSFLMPQPRNHPIFQPRFCEEYLQKQKKKIKITWCKSRNSLQGNRHLELKVKRV